MARHYPQYRLKVSRHYRSLLEEEAKGTGDNVTTIISRSCWALLQAQEGYAVEPPSMDGGEYVHIRLQPKLLHELREITKRTGQTLQSIIAASLGYFFGPERSHSKSGSGLSLRRLASMVEHGHDLHFHQKETQRLLGPYASERLEKATLHGDLKAALDLLVNLCPEANWSVHAKGRRRGNAHMMVGDPLSASVMASAADPAAALAACALKMAHILDGGQS
ncbi:hypothetical protein AncyloWKF20_05285 [Ancylobacter sp. WKF20]|uniref:hypothetical protein n=1 Tax=Ancylobacter sp. WKF20 TaxID=3039801 RepID=UPI00243439CB|nr:hypothetical protein [Ancylobacter sp. WKF20]WGD31238.1 hypothetical protein AncyloWKF20_05285 [Ancylobacter sp. WKF20]